MLQCKTMFIMFVDVAEAPSTNIMDIVSPYMGGRTTSVLKDLEHRNACVGLAGNNLELADNGSQNCRQQQYALDLADKSRRTSRHNISVMHVLV